MDISKLLNPNPRENPFGILSSVNENNEIENGIEEIIDYYAIVKVRKTKFTQERVLKIINEWVQKWKEEGKKQGKEERKVIGIVFLQTQDIKIHFKNGEDLNNFCQQDLIVDGTKLTCKPRNSCQKKEIVVQLSIVPFWVHTDDIKNKLSDYGNVKQVIWETHKHYPEFKNGHVSCTIEVTKNLNYTPGWFLFQYPNNPRRSLKVKVDFPGAIKACRICWERTHLPRACPNRHPCRFCKSIKHSPKYCRKRYNCYNCGQYGHIKRVCPNDKREVVYTRRDLIPSNEEKYMMNFHIVNHVEKNQEENSHGRKDESRGKKKKNNNKSGRGRECESASTSTSASASASTKINKNKNINENESTSEGIKVIASLTTKEKVRDKLLVHSQNTDTTDTESDANSDIVFDSEIDSEINSQLNTNFRDRFCPTYYLRTGHQYDQ